MPSSLPNLIDNLNKGIHKTKCKGCNCFFEYETVKDHLIKHECLSCNKDYSNKLKEELKNKFKNTFKFSNNEINRFILLLKKLFILINILMIQKTLMKQYYLQKKNFIAT